MVKAHLLSFVNQCVVLWSSTTYDDYVKSCWNSTSVFSQLFCLQFVPIAQLFTVIAIHCLPYSLQRPSLLYLLETYKYWGYFIWQILQILSVWKLIFRWWLLGPNQISQVKTFVILRHPLSSLGYYLVVKWSKIALRIP